MSENNIISALLGYANDEVKKQERQFKAEKAEYDKAKRTANKRRSR